ncbi:ChrR family anti-sigma-E factor [Polycladidibacter hongkongensis]|uniref:ChrR family anti-sigma-E factor n=1 Tax=Polycladidibacter hongkongensis TaxID=1647556 RepID=UPI00082D78EC|nr:ChrR family anti-sigma-E factor [Pseudovibrio hongkongensis]
MIRHHPSAEMLMSYSAGTLDTGQTLIVAAHLEACPTCATHALNARSIGGALLENALPTTLSENVTFECISDKIEQAERPAASELESPQPIKLANSLEAFTLSPLLQQVLQQSSSRLRWRFVAPGVRQCALPLFSSPAERVRLLALEPGFKTPEHSHHGFEHTLVLKGSYSDETGNYCKGDFQSVTAADCHQPVAGGEEECICLTVTSGAPRFTAFLPRLLRPFMDL